MERFEALFPFMQLMSAFKKVERAIRVPGTERFENDAEHSFELALGAWYVITTEKLPLDVGKAVRYALVHDLVEVYAGDVPLHKRTEETIRLKKEREHAALERIRSEFPEFPELIEAIEVYEKRSDEESVFVHALDKLLPMINIYFDNGRAWKERGISFQEVRDNKIVTTAASPTVHEYWKIFEKLLAARPDLFPPQLFEADKPNEQA